MEPGDTGSMVPGCNFTLAMCHDRWGNVLNFRGEPHVPTVAEQQLMTSSATTQFGVAAQQLFDENGKLITPNEGAVTTGNYGDNNFKKGLGVG
jgi:hypothetical protein